MDSQLPGIEEAVTATSNGLDLDLGGNVPVLAESSDLAPTTPKPISVRPANADAPMCYQCGVQMQRAGSCHSCPYCGTTAGCS